MGVVPDRRGLMREDAISVLVQHTLKPELPDTRADVQASPNFEILPLNRCRLGTRR
jgi:hypothetical protein